MLTNPILSPAPDAPASSGLTPENYQFLERYIHQETGISLGQDKRYLLDSRLAPVLQEERIASLNELCSRLRQGIPEKLRRRIAECMTTHETLFFRDPAVFNALRSEILPELAKSRQTARTLRIWSAAWSSGLLEAGYVDWKLDILGTDLSSRILERASTARYLQIEVNRGLPAPMLVKYFQRAGLDWQLKDEVRRFVRFAPFDLRQSMANLGPFDLVLCRNVMIYFDSDTRKRILADLRGTLAPGGYLLLGASETVFTPGPGLVRKTIGNPVFYQEASSGARR